ncbi:hypothetical protein F0344_02950 [Streptomyces finlayi]|uniref:Mce-associated membrane protein n=1 Tax=Streptomyces finlayi TaxID=67296 RepID=A0A7G7BED9_9ACTN|nr:hypothetical protein [Streptomyces finlayi]QNE73704.1 hypothetical protein F0344_02950 [Streptomyces finlayi]
MPTTRHLVNRQRRLATAAAERTTTTPAATPAPKPGPKEPDGPGSPQDAESGTDDAEDETPGDAPGEAPPEPRPTWLPRMVRVRLPAVLCALTLAFGAFAAWSFTSADRLREDPSRQNTALTDMGRTSEVKGQITEAVGAVFSYDYASPATARQAAKKYLVGRAVGQHEEMLAEVRAQAPKQKLVLTTTVTESGVELLDGDRARLLVFADQSNTRTGKADETTYAAAMFAVDAVRRGDNWRISAIDTFTQ